MQALGREKILGVVLNRAEKRHSSEAAPTTTRRITRQAMIVRGTHLKWLGADSGCDVALDHAILFETS